MNKHMVTRILVLIGGYLLLLLFLFNTNPQNLSVGLLIIPLIWLFLLLLITWYWLLGFLRLLTGHRLYTRRFVMAFLLALFPTILLVLRSIDQLGSGDILIVSVFTLFAMFYSNKLKIKR